MYLNKMRLWVAGTQLQHQGIAESRAKALVFKSPMICVNTNKKGVTECDRLFYYLPHAAVVRQQSTRLAEVEEKISVSIRVNLWLEFPPHDSGENLRIDEQGGRLRRC
jgi:hypothetical protein